MRPALVALPDCEGTVAPADGMPTSWPPQFTRAPPLLPGLMAASVWIASISSAACPFSPGCRDFWFCRQVRAGSGPQYPGDHRSRPRRVLGLPGRSSRSGYPEGDPAEHIPHTRLLVLDLARTADHGVQVLRPASCSEPVLRAPVLDDVHDPHLTF